MSEAIKPVKPELAPAVFTKMKNVSGRTLQLTCGAVKDGETVAFNAAELSILCFELEGVK